MNKHLVIEVGANYRCKILKNKEIFEVIFAGSLKNQKYASLNPIVIGDFVEIDESKSPYVIKKILDRKNYLCRYTSNNFQKEVLIAANVDKVFLMVSLKNPEPKFGFLDRCLTFCNIREIEPVLCVNKMDLVNKEDIASFKDYYKDCNFKIIFLSAKTGENINLLKEEFLDNICVIVGQSGVGKTSLVNQIFPEVDFKVNEVSEFNDKGKHTTTQSKMLFNNDLNSFIIDTPGIKTFNLLKKDKNLLPKKFPGFEQYNCKFSNCSHMTEIGCDIIASVNKEISEKRYISYKNIYSQI